MSVGLLGLSPLFEIDISKQPLYQMIVSGTDQKCKKRRTAKRVEISAES